jgi:hypothetical protein
MYNITKIEYISFIDKYCKNDILESSLYKYLNGIKNNKLINAILYRHNIIDLNERLTDEFKKKFIEFNDLLISRLEYKDKLKNAYNDLFISEKSKKDLYSYWNYDDEKNTEWVNYMSTLTKYDAPNIINNIKNYLISPILDIGGNNGTLSNKIKENNQILSVVVFDLPQVVKKGKEKFKNINFVSGNFLEEETIPHGYNTCIFKSVLHDHDDYSVIKLLNNIKTKFKRGIICEIMGDLKEITFQKPYFDYLIPFSNVIRKKEWYINLIKKLNMKIIKVNECKKTLYTTIIIDFN